MFGYSYFVNKACYQEILSTSVILNFHGIKESKWIDLFYSTIIQLRIRELWILSVTCSLLEDF